MHRYLFVLALGACVPDSGDEGLVILKNVAPGEGCSVLSQETEVGVTHGALSSVFVTQYQFIAQLKSKITALEGQEDQRIVFTTGANVDLTFPDSTFFSDAELDQMKTDGVTHFKSLFAASVFPNGGVADAGFDITTPALYDRIYAKAPHAKVVGGERFSLEVVATIKVIGTMGGDEVTSQPFAFPLSISNDRVISVAGTCPLAAGTELSLGNGCGRYQDVAVTCCSSGTDVVCPATVASMVTN